MTVPSLFVLKQCHCGGLLLESVLDVYAGLRGVLVVMERNYTIGRAI